MGATPHAVPIDLELLRAGSRLVWALIAAMAITAAATYWVADLSIDYRSLSTPVAVVAILAPVMVFYRVFRPDPGIFYSTEAITQIFLITLLGALLAYGAAASGLPLRDAELLAADRWLGFEPRAYLDFIYTHRWLGTFFPIVYLSMVYQLAIVFIVLMMTSRIDRLHDLAVALVVSLAITDTIFALFPALGWYAYLNIDPAAFPNLRLFWNFAAHVESVRDGTLHAVPLGDLRGVVSFPSYHTAAAVLAIWAVWPVRLARWPMLILNVLMVASAPVEGAHYLVDIICGAVVGACSAAAAAWTLPALRRRWAESARGRSAAAAAAIRSLPGAKPTWRELHSASSIYERVT